MQHKTEIDGIEYTITFTENSVELQWYNDETGLDRVLVFTELFIIPTRIGTSYIQYDVTPNGKRLNPKKHTLNSPPEVVSQFHQSSLSIAIKMLIVNGMTRYHLGLGSAVYDDKGNLL